MFYLLTTGQSDNSCGHSGDPGLLDTVSGTARPGALERERERELTGALQLTPCPPKDTKNSKILTH